MGILKLIPVGSVFGRWTVTSGPHKKPGSDFNRYECRCSCGTVKSVVATALRNGKSASCRLCLGYRPSKPITIGQKFGRITLIGREYKIGEEYLALGRCDCGETRPFSVPRLRNGNTKSCGCYLIENRHRMKARLSHGKKYTLVYSKWSGMLSRCRNPNTRQYQYYGGRGIEVCERWSEFENFYADMGDPPPKHSIERIDVNGNYDPSNCRWATDKEQANNRRNTRFYEFSGQRLTVSDAAALSGIPTPAISARMTMGWTIERAMSTPLVPRLYRRKIR